ncbi:MAG: tetratricopeptide repeat protein [Promethearchaeota archaeon]
MSLQIAPFNQSELNSIQEPLISKGWKETNSFGGNGSKFKYFIYPSNRIVSLTMEHEIPCPVKHPNYFNLGRVKFSLIASPGVTSAEYLKKLFTFWSVRLIEFEAEIRDHLSPIINMIASKVKESGNNNFSTYIARLPEPDLEKDENYFLQKIRLGLSREKSNLDYVTCKKLSRVFKALNIHPTNNFKDIIELSDGVAPALVDRLLVYKNKDYPEFIFHEPGFLTYYRDIVIENVKLRSYMDTYAMEALARFWEVDVGDFFKDLIKATRLLFTRFINQTSISDLKKVYFIRKNFDLFMKNYLKSYNDSRLDPDFKQLVFPVPNSWFETLQSSATRFPSWNLFTKPPESFDELQARRVFLENKQRVKQGNFTESASSYSRILAIFNKSGQKYGFFRTLIEIAKLASQVGKYQVAIDNYKLATDFAKKNDNLISLDEFITLQEEIVNLHLKFNKHDDAIRQITHLYNYLEKVLPEDDTKQIDILLKLNEIFISREDSGAIDAEIQNNFKKIKSFADKHKNKMILAQYHLVLGKYYMQKGKISAAISSLKNGLSVADSMGLIDIELSILIEFVKYYLYGKKRNLNYAQKYLEKANEIVGKTSDLRKELEIYDLLHDLYSQLDNYEKASFYDKEATRLRIALKTRGLL